eukprot:c17301_g1_i1.p1 GENE.c17301_g1_i1~~c17301_g1_i1.p1  ORF type:complete len:506 (-),score=66.05 c17301_g1_i1:383-1900(-)
MIRSSLFSRASPLLLIRRNLATHPSQSAVDQICQWVSAQGRKLFPQDLPGIIEAPVNIPWMPLKSRHLFVRPVYRELLTMIEQDRAGKREGILLIGNPGIGKSASLSYFLFHYLTAENSNVRTVVVERAAMSRAWVFTVEGGKVFGREVLAPRVKGAFISLLGSADLYLYDPVGEVAQEPLECSAYTIVASSPNPRSYKQFLKRVGQRRIVPTWEWQEIEFVVNSGVAEGVTRDQVREHFDMYGGIPRVVFNPNSIQFHEEAVVQAILTLPPGIVAGETLEKAIQQSHKFLQLVPSADLRRATFSFLSSKLEARVFDSLDRNSRNVLHTMSPLLFERLVLLSIADGCTCNSFVWSGPKEPQPEQSKMRFRRMARRYVDSLSTATPELNVLFISKNQREQGIEAFALVGDGFKQHLHLYQVTALQRPDEKHAHVQAVRDIAALISSRIGKLVPTKLIYLVGCNFDKLAKGGLPFATANDCHGIEIVVCDAAVMIGLKQIHHLIQSS